MAQIATIRIQTPSGAVSVPVYELADLTSPFRKVQTPNGVGGIKLESPGSAAHPYRKVNTPSGVMAYDELAAGATTVDSFEDQDIAEYGGATSSFSIATTPTPPDGSYALEASPSQATFETISSTSGLPAYPSDGDTFRCRVYLDGQAIPSVYYFTQSEVSDPNGYRIEVNDDGSGDAFALKVNGGLLVEDTNFTPPQGEWLDIEVATTTSGGHTAKLFDASGTELASVSTTDSTHTSGGIGFGNYSNNVAPVAYFDNFRIL